MFRWESTTPFWHAFRAGSEQDGGGIVGVARYESAAIADQRAGLVDDRNRLAQILEIDDPYRLGERPDELVQPRPLDKAARGDDRSHRGSGASGMDIGNTRTEIDHRRDAARGHHAEQCCGPTIGIWQHHTDRLALVGKRQELGGKQPGADQKLSVAELAGHRVLDCDAAPALDFSRVDDSLDDRAICRRRAEDQRHRRRPTSAAGSGTASLRRSRRRRRDAARRSAPTREAAQYA